jgi:hypothetical protein
MFTGALPIDHRTRGVQFSAVSPTFTNTEPVAGTKGARGLKTLSPKTSPTRSLG